MDEENDDTYVGMTIEEVDKILSQKGYKTLFFASDEEVDLTDLDRSYEWMAFVYDKNNKVIRAVSV